MYSRHYSVNATLKQEERLLDSLEEVLREKGLPDCHVRRFLLIVSEAFTNAVVHGCQSDPDCRIEIDLSINEEAVSVDITDQGRDGLARIAGREPANASSEGGRGVDIMRHCASSLEFAETGSGGLRVTARLSLKAENNSTGDI